MVLSTTSSDSSDSAVIFEEDERATAAAEFVKSGPELTKVACAVSAEVEKRPKTVKVLEPHEAQVDLVSETLDSTRDERGLIMMKTGFEQTSENLESGVGSVQPTIAGQARANELSTQGNELSANVQQKSVQKLGRGLESTTEKFSEQVTEAPNRGNLKNSAEKSAEFAEVSNLQGHEGAEKIAGISKTVVSESNAEPFVKDNAQKSKVVGAATAEVEPANLEKSKKIKDPHDAKSRGSKSSEFNETDELSNVETRNFAAVDQSDSRSGSGSRSLDQEEFAQDLKRQRLDQISIESTVEERQELTDISAFSPLSTEDSSEIVSPSSDSLL